MYECLDCDLSEDFLFMISINRFVIFYYRNMFTMKTVFVLMACLSIDMLEANACTPADLQPNLKQVSNL